MVWMASNCSNFIFMHRMASNSLMTNYLFLEFSRQLREMIFRFRIKLWRKLWKSTLAVVWSCRVIVIKIGSSFDTKIRSNVKRADVTRIRMGSAGWHAPESRVNIWAGSIHSMIDVNFYLDLYDWHFVRFRFRDVSEFVLVKSCPCFLVQEYCNGVAVQKWWLIAVKRITSVASRKWTSASVIRTDTDRCHRSIWIKRRVRWFGCDSANLDLMGRYTWARFLVCKNHISYRSVCEERRISWNYCVL